MHGFQQLGKTKTSQSVSVGKTPLQDVDLETKRKKAGELLTHAVEQFKQIRNLQCYNAANLEPIVTLISESAQKRLEEPFENLTSVFFSVLLENVICDGQKFDVTLMFSWKYNRVPQDVLTTHFCISINENLYCECYDCLNNVFYQRGPCVDRQIKWTNIDDKPINKIINFNILRHMQAMVIVCILEALFSEYNITYVYLCTLDPLIDGFFEISAKIGSGKFFTIYFTNENIQIVKHKSRIFTSETKWDCNNYTTFINTFNQEFQKIIPSYKITLKAENETTPTTHLLHCLERILDI